VPIFADDLEFEAFAGVGEVSGLGPAEALAVTSVLSPPDAVDCVADVDWARNRGAKEKIKTAASTRGFIVLESLLGLSQNHGTGSHDKDAIRSAGVNQPWLKFEESAVPTL